MDIETPPNTGTSAPDMNETTPEKIKQVSDHLPPTPTVPPVLSEKWEGDKRYFQTGKKAGQLKPNAHLDKQTVITGIDFSQIQKPDEPAPQAEATPSAPDKKAAKHHKNLILASTYSKIILRFLDTAVDYISGGEFGTLFTADQKKARNDYRDELDKNWVEYLQTMDLIGHPALVVIAGSALYVMPALQTVKGAEKTTKIKEKIFGKVGMAMFSFFRKK